MSFVIMLLILHKCITHNFVLRTLINSIIIIIILILRNCDTVEIPTCVFDTSRMNFVCVLMKTTVNVNIKNFMPNLFQAKYFTLKVPGQFFKKLK